MIWRRIRTSVSLSCLFTLAILTYNLATFLLNNYKQALAILKDSPRILARIMLDMNISSVEVFDDWLKEERVYLQGLKTEPEVETLQMEYYQKLINFRASE
jgi:hypothetical protein